MQPMNTTTEIPRAVIMIVMNVAVEIDEQHPMKPAIIRNRYKMNPIPPNKSAKFTRNIFICFILTQIY